MDIKETRTKTIFTANTTVEAFKSHFTREVDAGWWGTGLFCRDQRKSLRGRLRGRRFSLQAKHFTIAQYGTSMTSSISGKIEEEPHQIQVTLWIPWNTHIQWIFVVTSLIGAALGYLCYTKAFYPIIPFCVAFSLVFTFTCWFTATEIKDNLKVAVTFVTDLLTRLEKDGI